MSDREIASQLKANESSASSLAENNWAARAVADSQTEQVSKSNGALLLDSVRAMPQATWDEMQQHPMTTLSSIGVSAALGFAATKSNALGTAARMASYAMGGLYAGDIAYRGYQISNILSDNHANPADYGKNVQAMSKVLGEFGVDSVIMATLPLTKFATSGRISLGTTTRETVAPKDVTNPFRGGHTDVTKPFTGHGAGDVTQPFSGDHPALRMAMERTVTPAVTPAGEAANPMLLSLNEASRAGRGPRLDDHITNPFRTAERVEITNPFAGHGGDATRPFNSPGQRTMATEQIAAMLRESAAFQQQAAILKQGLTGQGKDWTRFNTQLANARAAGAGRSIDIWSTATTAEPVLTIKPTHAEPPREKMFGTRKPDDVTLPFPSEPIDITNPFGRKFPQPDPFVEALKRSGQPH